MNLKLSYTKPVDYCTMTKGYEKIRAVISMLG